MRLRPPLDDRSAWSSLGRCPIEEAMNILGSRNTMLIVREAYYGTRRFDDFVRRLSLSPATAASRLSGLVRAGLLERRPYREPGSRTREEYVLTRAGVDLMPVVLGLFQWGRRYTDVRPPLEVVHDDCGHPVEVRARCGEGHDVDLDHMELRVAGESAR